MYETQVPVILVMTKWLYNYTGCSFGDLLLQTVALGQQEPNPLCGFLSNNSLRVTLAVLIYYLSYIDLFN